MEGHCWCYPVLGVSMMRLRPGGSLPRLLGQEAAEPGWGPRRSDLYLERCCPVRKGHLGQGLSGAPSRPCRCPPAPAPGRPGRVGLLARAGSLAVPRNAGLWGRLPWQLSALSSPSLLVGPTRSAPPAPTHCRHPRPSQLCPLSTQAPGPGPSPFVSPHDHRHKRG